MNGWRGAVCERCFEWAACFDGLCGQCRETLRPREVAYLPPVALNQCEVCGKDTSHTVCGRCNQQFVEEMEPTR